MINIGKFNKLTISRAHDTKVYLDGGENGEILLDPQQTNEQYATGSQLNVFVYVDGQGSLHATLQTPLAQLDDVSWLKVVSLSHAGAFLDWGLPKDLLVPFSEQKQKMVEGRYYLVKLFLDESNRIAASTLLDDFIQDEAVYLKEGQQVDLIIADETELGVKAVINNAFWGVLYKNELFQTLKKGQKIKGFIKKIRPDKKIDLTLAVEKFSHKADSTAVQILDKLKQHGGEMKLTDKSPPQVIYDTFGCSKKVFKQALGGLYKKKLINILDGSIQLTGKK